MILVSLPRDSEEWGQCPRGLDSCLSWMTLFLLRRRSGHAWKCEFPEGCHRVAFFMLTKKSRDRTSTAKFCREHCESVSMPIELRKRRRCMTVGCDRQASQALFAYDASHSDLRANWCTEHAPDGSINVVSSRCVFVRNRFWM
jgi:hypothetical protein